MLFSGGVLVLHVRSSVATHMARGNGTLSRMTVMEVKMTARERGKVLSSAQMTGHLYQAWDYEVPCIVNEGHAGSGVELGVRMLCSSSANRMELYWADKHVVRWSPHQLTTLS